MAPILKMWLASSIAIAPLLSKDLGPQGHLFPIMEEDLLRIIKKKVGAFTANEWAALEQKIRQNYVQIAEEPPTVKNLKETKAYRSFLYDPSTVVSNDIIDHQGHVVVAKGSTLNPLTIFGLSENLLFIDGSKESHLQWAETQGLQSKWILVKGRPLELEERFQKRIFFDQFGHLTQKLGVKNVPAKASQNGLKIEIEEIPLRMP